MSDEPTQLTKGRLDGLMLSPLVDGGWLKCVHVTIDTLPGMRIVVEAEAIQELHTALGILLDNYKVPSEH